MLHTVIKLIKRNIKFINIMFDIENVILKVADFIKKYKTLNNTQFKFTLGKYNTIFGFEKQLYQESKYNDILKLLNKCSTWDNKYEKNTKKINPESDNVIDNLIIICENGPYDIILTVEPINKIQYNDYSLDETNNDETNNNEKIYIRKYHSFVLNKITSNVNDTIYNLSLIPELPLGYTDTYISHSSLLKMCDLISVCNDVNGSLSLKILQKKN